MNELSTVEKPIVQPVEAFRSLGGLEGLGSEGGYHNIQLRFGELLAFDSVQRWLRKRAATTKAQYLVLFQKFLTWTGNEVGVQDPEGLLAWARRQPDGVMVQDLIDEYAEGLPKSQGHILTALVRSFLVRNGYKDLPKIDWDSTVSFTEGYKRSEIQQLLAYLDQPLQKFYVLTAKDSGLRANDLLYIRYKHVKEDLEAGAQYVHVRFEKERYQRRKAPGRTFIGPNAVTLLQQLIKEGVVRADLEAKVFPFAYRSITHAITLAKRKANLNPALQPSHGLRKFFENSLDRVGMDHHKKLQLEGHSQGVRNAYTSRELEELRELYGQAYRYLDLSEEAAADRRVVDLEKTVEGQKQKITELEQRLTRAGEIEQRLSRIEARMRKDLQE